MKYAVYSGVICFLVTLSCEIQIAKGYGTNKFNLTE